MPEDISQPNNSIYPNHDFVGVLIDVLQAITDKHEEVRAKTKVYDAFGDLPGAPAVAEYILRYRREDVPALQFGGPLDLFPADPLPHGIPVPFTWADPWPLGGLAGVYLIYSVGLKILYIGKASMDRVLGQRLYDYFGGGPVCTLRAPWPEPPRFVITIAPPQQMPFEAPALEEFLIRALQPTYNTHGMNR